MKRNNKATIKDFIDIIKACESKDVELKEKAISSLNSAINVGLTRYVNSIALGDSVVDSYFRKAISASAISALRRIFYEIKYVDLNKLRPGSVVKLRHDSENWLGGFPWKEATIVFMDKPYFVNVQGEFIPKCSKNKIWTFERNGKFCSFHADNGVDFIEEVIKY